MVIIDVFRLGFYRSFKISTETFVGHFSRFLNVLMPIYIFPTETF